MNYRHHFHAGNFADLVKHAGLMAALAALTRGKEPLTVVDTHAGAGLYDLGGEMARKSGEAEAGIGRLMVADDAPAALAPLVRAVRRANPDGGARFYPGSPWLTVSALRPGDRLVACELRPEDAQALAKNLPAALAAVETVIGDGFAAASGRIPKSGACLVLIDPPFERGDDYEQARRALAGVLARNPEAVVMVWLPLKDLETFDAFLRLVEADHPPALLVAETRLRRLSDPMKMNGCALVTANPPAGLEEAFGEACGWVAASSGEAGAEARVWRL